MEKGTLSIYDTPSKLPWRSPLLGCKIRLFSLWPVQKICREPIADLSAIHSARQSCESRPAIVFWRETDQIRWTSANAYQGAAMTSRETKNLKNLIIITLTATGIGLLYPLFFDEPGNITALLNGVTIGFLGGLWISYFELYIVPKRFRKLSFIKILTLRSVLYVAHLPIIIILIVNLTTTLRDGRDFFDNLASEQMRAFIFEEDFIVIFFYAVCASFAINFVRQINRKMGAGALFNYVTGKYLDPREEERIFMFLDLKSSTTIAEKLGNVRYSHFLSDYFFEISDPIIESHGEIYQYVGDEAVITWTMERGLRESDCLWCYFRILERIDQLRDTFHAQYGVAPEFKAGVHCGKVVITEIGDAKSDIVFHGDVLNTAARIQGECNRFASKLLISDALKERLQPHDRLRFESRGKILLRGKERETELFAVGRISDELRVVGEGRNGTESSVKN